jgi:hypothetical protein
VTRFAPPSIETSTTETPAADWHATTLKGRAREIFDLWQTICEPAGLPPETYTRTLERAIVDCIRDHGAYPLWQQALREMATNPYYKTAKAWG